jgi:hypothetical protein
MRNGRWKGQPSARPGSLEHSALRIGHLALIESNPWVMPEKDSSTRNPALPSGWKNASRKRSERDRRGKGGDPERARQLESFRLARTEMQRQLETTTHDARKQQLKQAIAELDRRIKELS